MEARIALWQSREQSKTDYSGKINFADGNGNIDFNDQASTCTAFLFYSDSGLEGNVVDQNKDRVYTLWLEKQNDGASEKAPDMKGRLCNPQDGSAIYDVAVWLNNSENPKAPKLSGTVSELSPAF